MSVLWIALDGETQTLPVSTAKLKTGEFLLRQNFNRVD
jgi:hypothetical protein